MNKVRRSLRTHRENNDVRGLLGVLEMCVRHNFGGVESARCVTFITSDRNRIWPYLVFQQAIQRGALRCAATTGMKIDMEHHAIKTFYGTKYLIEC